MFEIGWTELLLVAVVAIVVIGPKDLPRVMRMVGQWTAKTKRMARDFQGQFNEALREAELDGVRRDVESVKKDFDKLTKVDPMAGVRKEMTRTTDEIRAGLDKPAAVAEAEKEQELLPPPPATEALAAPHPAEVSGAPAASTRAAPAGDGER